MEIEFTDENYDAFALAIIKPVTPEQALVMIEENKNTITDDLKCYVDHFYRNGLTREQIERETMATSAQVRKIVREKYGKWKVAKNGERRY